MKDQFCVGLSEGDRISNRQAEIAADVMTQDMRKRLLAKLKTSRFLAGHRVRVTCTVKFLDRENDAEEIGRMRERGDPLVEL